jgi:Spy/CpxP family protein refolding chaperone
MNFSFSRTIVPAVLTIGLVAGVAHVASSDTTMSHGHMMHHRGGMSSLGIPLPILLRNANLTEAQKQQVHKIFSDRRTASKSEFEQLKAAKEQIAAKYASAGPVTAADLSAPLQQLNQVQEQMTKEQLQDAIAIRNLLTPDQVKNLGQTKSKLDQIRSEMKSLFAKGDGSKPTE